VLVIQLQKRPHRIVLSRLSKIAVMVRSWFIQNPGQAHGRAGAAAVCAASGPVSGPELAHGVKPCAAATGGGHGACEPGEEQQGRVHHQRLLQGGGQILV